MSSDVIIFAMLMSSSYPGLIGPRAVGKGGKKRPSGRGLRKFLDIRQWIYSGQIWPLKWQERVNKIYIFPYFKPRHLFAGKVYNLKCICLAVAPNWDLLNFFPLWQMDTMSPSSPFRSCSNRLTGFPPNGPEPVHGGWGGSDSTGDWIPSYSPQILSLMISHLPH
jgi:hypothetical protein